MAFFIKHIRIVLLTCIFAAYSFAQDNLEEGIQLFQDGRLVEARQFFEIIQKQQPANSQISFYLGRIAFEEKEYEQAIDWFSQAMDQTVDDEQCNVEFSLWLGRAYGYHAQQVNIFRQPFLAKRVQENFEKAIVCDPNHVAARWDLMEYYLKAPGFLGGSTENAKKQATHIQQLDPEEGQKAWALIAEITK